MTFLILALLGLVISEKKKSSAAPTSSMLPTPFLDAPKVVDLISPGPDISAPVSQPVIQPVITPAIQAIIQESQPSAQYLATVAAQGQDAEASAQAKQQAAAVNASIQAAAAASSAGSAEAAWEEGIRTKLTALAQEVEHGIASYGFLLPSNTSDPFTLVPALGSYTQNLDHSDLETHWRAYLNAWAAIMNGNQLTYQLRQNFTAAATSLQESEKEFLLAIDGKMGANFGFASATLSVIDLSKIPF